MGVWTFVVLYLVAFVLVQLAVYRYLRGRNDDEPSVAFAGRANADRGPREDPPDGSDRDGQVVESARRSAGGDGDVRRCPNCGAANEGDAPFTFCRNCASRLPG